jgi:hypothetical protein
MSDVQMIAWLRFWLGNLPITTISDADLQIILDGVRAQYPSANDCQIQYYFAVATLEWLLRQEAQGSAGQAGSGDVKKRTEERGRTKITQEWDVGSSSGASTGWDAVLEDLLADPNSVGCSVFPPSGDAQSGSVIIDGQGVGLYETNAPWLKSTQRRKSGSWLN